MSKLLLARVFARLSAFVAEYKGKRTRFIQDRDEEASMLVARELTVPEGKFPGRCSQTSINTDCTCCLIFAEAWPCSATVASRPVAAHLHDTS